MISKNSIQQAGGTLNDNLVIGNKWLIIVHVYTHSMSTSCMITLIKAVSVCVHQAGVTSAIFLLAWCSNCNGNKTFCSAGGKQQVWLMFGEMKGRMVKCSTCSCSLVDLFSHSHILSDPLCDALLCSPIRLQAEECSYLGIISEGLWTPSKLRQTRIRSPSILITGCFCI